MATRHSLICYSTSHLSEADAQLADRLGQDIPNLNCPHFVANTGYGWMFWVPANAKIDRKGLEYVGFSPALADVLKHAQKNHPGINYVMFDRDEPANDDLKSFEW